MKEVKDHRIGFNPGAMDKDKGAKKKVDAKVVADKNASKKVEDIKSDLDCRRNDRPAEEQAVDNKSKVIKDKAKQSNIKDYKD